MTERCVSFDCHGESLIGIVHEPASTAGETGVVIIVGGPQYRVGSHRQFVLMARAFAAAGYPVLRFDYRGMGDSSGEPRSFDAVDDDVEAAMDTLIAACPAIRRVVLFGLCDAASAALMYRIDDARVGGLILANPWVRTESGQAKALVQHYYGNRLLQRSFWHKLFAGQVDVRASIVSLFSTLARSRAAPGRDASAGPSAFIDRMLRGAQLADRPTLLLMSGEDLTAREFDDLCRSSPQWQKAISRPGVRRIDLPEADHTFSVNQSLENASKAALNWLREL